MKIPFKIQNKVYHLEPYNTKQETKVLLLNSLSQDKEYNLNETLRIFGLTDIEELSKKEKILLLYLYRGISVGDECRLNFTCSSCEGISQNSFIFDFYNTMLQKHEELAKKNTYVKVQNKKIFQSDVKILDEYPNTDNLHEYLTVKIDLEEIDLMEFEAILGLVTKVQETLSFKKELSCSHCRQKNTLYCDDYDFALDQISECTLIVIYETINKMAMLGYSKTDVDNLLPFEREILMDLMIQSIEKQAEQKARQYL